MNSFQKKKKKKKKKNFTNSIHPNIALTLIPRNYRRRTTECTNQCINNNEILSQHLCNPAFRYRTRLLPVFCLFILRSITLDRLICGVDGVLAVGEERAEILLCLIAALRFPSPVEIVDPVRSLDRTSFPAMSLTRMAGSSSNSRIASSRSYCARRRPCSSLESQMLLTIRSRFSRTAALLWCIFSPIRVKRSGRASVDAIAGLSRSSFCSGSKRFSNALALEMVRHLTMASVNDGL